MTEYYYRSHFDKDGGLGCFPLDQTQEAINGDMKVSVYESFKQDVRNWYNDGRVVLCATLTIHPKLKYHNRLVRDQSPRFQESCLKELINKSLGKYHRKYQTGISAYFFFEAQPLSGTLHAHGIVCHGRDNTESYYPIHIAQLKQCFMKAGFSSYGTKIEYPKYLESWFTYQSKDVGICKVVPLYVYR